MLFFHANRSALLIRGLVFFILGLIGLFRPIGSLAAITVILGVFLLLDAMGALFLTFACRRYLGVFWSLLLCVAGVVMIVRPVEADVMIAVVLGVWLIATGVSELVSASVSPSRLFLSGSGVLSILIGILLAVAPFAGLAAFSTIVAVLLLISGAGMLALVFGLRVPGLGAGGRRKGERNE
jgi:uncharacterized membrane protein HdeD (DUF308 family)